MKVAALSLCLFMLSGCFIPLRQNESDESLYRLTGILIQPTEWPPVQRGSYWRHELPPLYWSLSSLGESLTEARASETDGNDASPTLQ